MKLKNSIFIIAAAILLFYGCDEFTTTTENPTSETEVVEGTKAATKPTLLLTIDGGGVKGIVPATILAQLEEDLGKPIYQIFDVIGGTSTGGIITVGLTSPENPEAGRISAPRIAQKIKNIYLDNCNEMLFPVPDDDTGPFYYADRAASLDGFYPAGGVERYLQKLLGKKYSLLDAYNNMVKLPDSKVRDVFTTCYVVNGKRGANQTEAIMGTNYGPYEFSWENARKTTNPSENYYAWEAARGTSAAPIYFPVAHVGGGEYTRSHTQERWVIDGGMVTNNPIITGLERIRKRNGNISNVVAISLGCGINPFNGGIGITNEKANHPNANPHEYGQKYGFWNTYDWAGANLYNLSGVEAGRARIIETLMFANQFTADNQFQNMIDNRAIKDGIRLQPHLPENIDDSFECDMVTALEQAAIDYITKNPKGIAEYNKLKSLLEKYL